MTNPYDAVIAGRTSLQLCADFNATNELNDEHIPTIRGWMMDALEARHPEAFAAWIDSCQDDPTPFIKRSIEHQDYNREADIAPWSIQA